MCMGFPNSHDFLYCVGGDRSKMSSNHDTYPLWASSDDERKSWVLVIRKVIYHDRGGGKYRYNHVHQHTMCVSESTEDWYM